MASLLLVFPEGAGAAAGEGQQGSAGVKSLPCWAQSYRATNLPHSTELLLRGCKKPHIPLPFNWKVSVQRIPVEQLSRSHGGAVSASFPPLLGMVMNCGFWPSWQDWRSSSENEGQDCRKQLVQECHWDLCTSKIPTEASK